MFFEPSYSMNYRVSWQAEISTLYERIPIFFWEGALLITFQISGGQQLAHGKSFQPAEAYLKTYLYSTVYIQRGYCRFERPVLR